MDMSEKNESEADKRNEEALNFHSVNMPSDWQLNSANLANASMGLIPNSNPMTDSFCPTIWDQTVNAVNLGFRETNVHPSAGSSNILGPGNVGVDRNLGMFWAQPNAMLKGGMFLPNVSGILPQSTPHFPADSDFIERAARFSCFGGDMINTFNATESVNPYSRGLLQPQKAHEVVGNESKSAPGIQYQESETTNVAESSKEGSLPNEDIHSKNDNSFDAKQSVEGFGNESDEPECSGHGDQEISESSAKGFVSKKRKRNNQHAEHDKSKGTTPKEDKDQNLISSAGKQSGKNGKQGSQSSDPPKEEYIHVRARRGQATNSHSLAERVRREKISQRMKFLQDLVPGCNKVTGKAVMLDEIINYVQSLQRQVEFLSMKLATVIPRMDFNIEGLLAKDILQSQAGPSSSLTFPPDITMPYPPINPSQPSLLQAGLAGFGNPINALQRTINSEKATMNVPNVWDNDFHTVFEMGFKPNANLSNQDHSSVPSAQTNSEA